MTAFLKKKSPQELLTLLMDRLGVADQELAALLSVDVDQVKHWKTDIPIPHDKAQELAALGSDSKDLVYPRTKLFQQFGKAGAAREIMDILLRRTSPGDRLSVFR